MCLSPCRGAAGARSPRRKPVVRRVGGAKGLALDAEHGQMSPEGRPHIGRVLFDAE